MEPFDGHFLKEILESVHFCVYGGNSLTKYQITEVLEIIKFTAIGQRTL